MRKPFLPNICTENIVSDSSVLKMLLRGYQSKITMVAPSGVYHSYLISRPKNESGFSDDIRFVYVLHDNKFEKNYLGKLSKYGFNLTRASEYLEDTDIVKGINYLSKLSEFEDGVEKSKMAIYHDGRCAVCGRKLENEKSLKAGVGKRCIKRLCR